MFDFMWKKKRLNNAAHRLFCDVIEQSRFTTFYQNFDVEDTLDGRFDIMAIHMSIILYKLDQHKEFEDAKVVKRIIQEIMFDNLDLSLREIGVGDLGVGKKIKVMAEAFYGRMKVYQALFENKSYDKMAETLKRNLYRGAEIENKILSGMTKYVYYQCDKIINQPIEQILKGNITFLSPDGEA
ncbi:MAG: hypothetical protein HOH19_12460 [Kordiimonadaceae bacterium]|jgi:cytochrome b pre-mRNA-processing protein 3|nr:hypothetical protein [Kordiimonadaceae bacterium]MBT6033379.1 hypothetical protein [Kordiimonadaceae bacterium]